MRFAAFVRLSRVTFLAGGFAGFALGVAVAAFEGARIPWAAYAAGQLMVTAFHAMTHYANDYFDRFSDAGGKPTEFAGGSGVLAAGELAPRVALIAALVCGAVGLACAGAFALAGAVVPATIGGAIGVLAWAYSAPPARLLARGWGELDATAVVAVLVPLAGYATITRSVDARMLLATLPPACAMFAMMLAVQWPDRAADAAGGKRNLLVRWGARAAGRVAAACAAGAWICATFVVPGRAAPLTAVLFGLLAAGPLGGFARSVVGAGNAAEIAARGVSAYFLIVVFGLLSYLSVLR
jgi:1,4-dihydroxy-2-naphthoate octaprenyltransferase